ncbi:DUF3108 domain-containing protein [Ramlibacter sp. AN1015]|uniref:DUF3108 domain-containing protein n=1 Tax=Ramlibacter sp. AN1015 TaxID=3133428 RepID=UPI0030C1672C
MARRTHLRARRPLLRRVALVALVLLVHALALEWVARQHRQPSALQQVAEPMFTRLLAPEAPPPPGPGAAAATAAPASAPRPTITMLPPQAVPPASAPERDTEVASAPDTDTDTVVPEPPQPEPPQPPPELTRAEPTPADPPSRPDELETAAVPPAPTPPEPPAAPSADPAVAALTPQLQPNSAAVPAMPEEVPATPGAQGAPTTPQPPAGQAPSEEAPSLGQAPESGAKDGGSGPIDRWPGDSRLSYALTGQYRGGPLYGGAQVQWHRDGEQYQTRVAIDVSLAGTRVLTSQGQVTPQGLVPRVYEETRRGSRRSVRMDPQTVQLEGGGVASRPPDLQDTASQFVDLGHRFATGRDTLEVGRSISVWLARPGGIDLWTYDVAERETLTLQQHGTVEAFRLTPRRLNKPRGNFTADIWFAPSLQYLPVRIRVRMGEEDFVDLLVERIEQR